MKKMKRTASLLLAALLLLALAACGESFESAMAKATAEMEKVESMHAEMEMVMEMAISAEGQSMDMDMAIDMSMDTINDPLLAKIDMTSEMMGMSIPALMYVEQDGEQFVTYMSVDGGATWQVQGGMTEADVGSYDPADSVAFYLDCAESFEKTGEEEVNGAMAVRYDGVIPEDKMQEAMELSGAMDQLAELGGDAGAALSGSIPLSIWLDKESGLPVRYDMDMSEVMASMMSAVDMGGAAVEIGKVTVSMVLSNFNGVSGIEVPAEAKAAA